MIRRPADDDIRKPQILIPDNTPISLLGAVNELDLLFKPTGTLWMTDVVMDEAKRPRKEAQHLREVVSEWIDVNRYRIKRVQTRQGRLMEQMQRLWVAAGRPDDDRPDLADFGERSIADAVSNARDIPEEDGAFVAIVDDRDGRDIMRNVRADIDLMGTRTFIRWIAEDYDGQDPAELWARIVRATKGTADPGLGDDDPEYIRRRTPFG